MLTIMVKNARAAEPPFFKEVVHHAQQVGFHVDCPAPPFLVSPGSSLIVTSFRKSRFGERTEAASEEKSCQSGREENLFTLYGCSYFLKRQQYLLALLSHMLSIIV